jgi:hypothetical protein
VRSEDVVNRDDVRLDTMVGGAEAEESSSEDDGTATVEASGTREDLVMTEEDSIGAGDEDGAGPSDAESAKLLGGGVILVADGATLVEDSGVLDGAGETLLGPGTTMEEEGGGGGTELLGGGGGWLLGGGTALEERGGGGILELGGGGGGDEVAGGGGGVELGGGGGSDELDGGGGRGGPTVGRGGVAWEVVGGKTADSGVPR